ncbi:LOW QUALITY PROTEIN: hypothetical protein HID58_081840, partial [Brassica napus]
MAVAGGLTALTIEMVLIDSNADSCYCQERFSKPFLSQGITKSFISFSLNHNCGSYGTTNHPYKNVIFLTTRVRVCKDLPRALTGFQKFSYRAILDGSPNSDHLVVVEVTHVEVASVNGKDTHKISPKFRNSFDDRLPIVLCGKFSADIDDAIQLFSYSTGG